MNRPFSLFVGLVNTFAFVAELMFPRKDPVWLMLDALFACLNLTLAFYNPK